MTKFTSYLTKYHLKQTDIFIKGYMFESDNNLCNKQKDE